MLTRLTPWIIEGPSHNLIAYNPPSALALSFGPGHMVPVCRLNRPHRSVDGQPHGAYSLLRVNRPWNCDLELATPIRWVTQKLSWREEAVTYVICEPCIGV